MINWNYIAHIIKDVFGLEGTVLHYGEDTTLASILNGSEFGVETWGLYTNYYNQLFIPNFHHWDIGLNNSYFGHDFCNLFLSFNYHPAVIARPTGERALSIARLLKKNGLIVLVNAGNWADDLNSVFGVRQDLINQIQRFSAFKNANVRVFQNDL